MSSPPNQFPVFTYIKENIPNTPKKKRVFMECENIEKIAINLDKTLFNEEATKAQKNLFD